MPLHEPPEEAEEHAAAAMQTGRRGQRLICEAWFASHADSGTPGPHLRLRTSDGEDAVLRTDQVPDLITMLERVAEHTDRAYAAEGDQYAAEVVLKSPDPQDPEVVRQRRLRRLRFTQLVFDHLPEVTRMLAGASSTDEALATIAGLLDVDEVDVMIGLARLDLLQMTRPATKRRLRMLATTLEE